MPLQVRHPANKGQALDSQPQDSGVVGIEMQAEWVVVQPLMVRRVIIILVNGDCPGDGPLNHPSCVCGGTDHHREMFHQTAARDVGGYRQERV